jgi:translocation and assembly module TamA
VARLAATLVLVSLFSSAHANELRYVVSGVGDPLKTNILAHVENVRFGSEAPLSERGFDEVVADTERRARAALRPYGYYRPEVMARIERETEDLTRVSLQINPGPPMIILAAQVKVVGAGADEAVFRQWQRSWPLVEGNILVQPVWEAQKVQAIEDAKSLGYLGAEFSEHVLELDLNANTATLRLTLDTGPQYMFGDIDYGKHVLKPGILEVIPRFSKGEPYNSDILETFRNDLWKTGYFTDVNVHEIVQPEESPPEVDLKVTLETDHKNSYQGSLGLGTDTGMRLQAQWSRHPVSRNGDRLDTGIGWQDEDDEYSAHTSYRLPRLTRQRQYWVADVFAKFENMDLEIKRDPEDENFIKIGDGNINEYHVRTGRLKVRNLKRGNRQMFETLFLQFLHTRQKFDLLYPLPIREKEDTNVIDQSDNNFSLGYDVDVVEVNGKGFDTEGRRDRAWIFHSSNVMGSDHEFTQAYFSTRRIYHKGERWKFLVRGEVGYTEARVSNVVIEVDGVSVPVSLTELPNFYRFKAGGSQSVRGYGFESLSNNDIGSNHIITASVEAELRLLKNWSAAAFMDIGNAFNDWSKPELRKGAGIGIRWYSIAGPVSLDVAQALDVIGKPWRIHFTIGTPLL